MPQLALFLLGPPRLQMKGEPLEVSRRKAMALIAYLAVTGRRHTRDALATLLWPEYGQSRARAALRRTLSALNTALEGAWLEADRETIDLIRGEGFWVDVVQFRKRLAAAFEHDHPETETCPACLSLLAEAVALYQDDFMAGFTLRDSPEFDDWQFFQAESLRHELAGALERLVRTHCAQGEYEPAVRYARRWLRLDPLHEEAHRQLMLLYAWTDQRAAALRQYQECARVLQEELGVPPSEETTALHERIRAGGPSIREGEQGRAASYAPPGPASPTARGVFITPPRALEPPSPLLFLTPPPEPFPLPAPFVAREEELAKLKECLDAALGGRGHVAFVTGEAGSGKTAIIREFARRAQESVLDLLVATGNCNAYTGLGDPYLPFREILGLLSGEVEVRWAQGTITGENARRLWELVPTSLQTLLEVGPDLIDSLIPATLLGGRATTLGPDGVAWAERLERLVERRRTEPPVGSQAQSDLFEQYTRVLQTLARHQPLLLVVDDAQWADTASINLLFHLSRRLGGSRVLLVITYRPDDIALGRSGERHPLEPVINELKRTYGDVWIDLDLAMGRHFVDALLDTEPNRLAETFRAALHHQTEGHPLFTVELLRAMQQRGELVQDPDGHWIEGPTLDWETLPMRVEALIEERVGRLQAGLRNTLAVASVEGETFTAQVVARVQGIGERPLLQSLSQELERRHQLVQAQGEVRVDHQFLSRYRFTHTVFQQYLYNTFGPGERRLLHGEIAAALEDLYREESEEVTVQLARHYTEAGQAEQAVDYLLRAGDRARGLYAHQEAIDFYRRALTFLKEEGADERAARTLMKLGLTYHLAFDFASARQAYQEGFALWQRAGANQTAASPAAHPLRMTWYDPPTLDPTVAMDTTSEGIIDQLFSGLVALNSELDVVPEVAQSWEVLEGGSEYVFHLRDDIHWSDGTLVTAEDFVYAWRRVLDPGIGSFNASYLYDIKGARAYHQGQLSDPDQLGIRAPDELTLLVEMEGPTGYFPQLLTHTALFPVPRHVVEAHGAAWTEMRHLVTNGPFKLERWQPGHSILLTRNPDYCGKFTGNVEEVTLTLGVEKSAERLAMYEADRLDIVYLYPSPEGNWMRERHAAEYLSGPSLRIQYIGFNARQPPLEDPRVRRALTMATDREKLASRTLWGYEFPALGSCIPPGMPGHSPTIGLPHDPEEARRLLAEAGYPAGKDFPVLEGLVAYEKEFVSDLTEQWRENLGVDVAWQAVDWDVLLDRLERNPPPLFQMGWIADYPDPDNLLKVGIHSDWIGWRNETYSGLLEQARRITNQPERLALYQQADRILIEEAAVMPILYGRQHWLVKPWVRKFSTPVINLPFWKDIIIEPHA